MKNKKLQKALKISAGVLFWILLWQFSAMAFGKPLIFPTPIATAAKLLELMRTSAFYTTVLKSLLRIFEGFLVGVAAGTLIGAVNGFDYKLSGVAEAFTVPVIAVLRATPVASVIILMFYFLSRQNIPAFTSALIVTPIVSEAVKKGLKETDVQLREVAEVFGFGFWKKLLRLYIPSAAPYFYTACRSSVGLAWKSGVAAEVICNLPGSIGNMLYNAKITLEAEDLFAWTAATVILSVLLEKVLVSLLDAAVGREKCRLK